MKFTSLKYSHSYSLIHGFDAEPCLQGNENVRKVKTIS